MATSDRGVISFKHELSQKETWQLFFFFFSFFLGATRIPENLQNKILVHFLCDEEGEKRSLIVGARTPQTSCWRLEKIIRTPKKPIQRNKTTWNAQRNGCIRSCTSSQIQNYLQRPRRSLQFFLHNWSYDHQKFFLFLMFRTLPSGVEKSQKHFAICKIKDDQRYGSCRYVVFVRHDITNAVFFLELIHNSHLMDFERNIEARHGENKLTPTNIRDRQIPGRT